MPSTQIINVKVTPKSSGDSITGWTDSSPAELSVRVTAPPDKGKANEAVCKLIAKSIGVPKSSVEVVRGQTSRHKQVAIDVDEETFEKWKASI